MAPYYAPFPLNTLVYKLWEIVAKEEKSYADAIRSVVCQRNSEGGCRVGDNSQKSVKAARADNPEGCVALVSRA